MKKNGFTLAEVLITLAIIGVIATMTLPALMTNTAEQQAKSGLKKGINTLTEAAQMNNAIDGFDYSSFSSTSTDDTETISMFALLANRAAVDLVKSGVGKHVQIKDNSSNYTMFFRDGSSLSFKVADTAAEKAWNKDRLDDGLPKGFGAIYDYNGNKKPNQLSNCLGETGGMVSSKNDSPNAPDVACTKSMRVIKDQFGIRLRGSYAVPNGAAARWAMEN